MTSKWRFFYNDRIAFFSKAATIQGDRTILWKIAQNVAQHIFLAKEILLWEKVAQELWRATSSIFKKLAKVVKQSPNRRKFAQSGHPATITSHESLDCQPGLPDFSRYDIRKWGKYMYTKRPQTLPNEHLLYMYTKWPKTIPNDHKLYQMTTN
jgi:hypothetical protein